MAVEQEVTQAAKTFEIWFFREISDEQRRSLIALMLGGGIADEAINHGHQRLCLGRIIGSLSVSPAWLLGLVPDTPPSPMEVTPGHGYEIYKRDKVVVSDSVTKSVIPDLAKSVARLNRSTWDSRVLPMREDVRALLDAYRLLANPEPPLGQCVRYRGWDCYHEQPDVAYQGQPGFVAYLGGADIDAPQVDARTWVGLLDEIDDHDKMEDAA